MPNDMEIAAQVALKPITEIAAQLGLKEEEIEQYGRYKAKIPLDVISRFADRPDGRFVLVTSINPTTAGEGKTTVTVGLGQALAHIGKKATICVREPSLGPCLGMKGGATGGGHAQVVPMEDINLHFTGDMHAITTAHNLLAALLDNHMHQGNRLGIDPRTVTWPRVMDMNERALRHITIGLGGKAHGVPRESGFIITVASEVMAILCLATSVRDLKDRLGRIIVATTYEGKPVTAHELNAEGAMAAMLKDALKPNLVQTLEHSPALIHGGPFANIAHGTNSVLATKLALKLSDFVIQETGFGADLGFEKFCDIVSRESGIVPDAVVVVATVRALKLHGGADKTQLTVEDEAALEAGLVNLEKQIENVRLYGLQPIVAINRFPADTQNELDAVLALGHRLGAPVILCDVWGHGGEGGAELAKAVTQAATSGSGRFQPLYPLEMPLTEKIRTVVQRVYGGEDVDFSPAAAKELQRFTDLGYGNLPVCLAKTQYSLSDNPALVGRPQGFRITVREVRLSAGAGFVVAMCGNVMTMPGLPKVPGAERIDLDDEGRIHGLF